MLRTGCNVRRALCALLTAVLLLSLCACGNDEPKPGYGTVEPGRAAGMLSRGYIIENNLEVEYIEDTVGNTVISYPVISGLADKALEKRINKRIKDTACSMVENERIPSYRGIDVMLKRYENAEHNTDYSCWITGSCNNLLSLEFYASHYFNDIDPSDDSYFYYSTVEVMNIDLADGRDLTLADLFDKDTNYLDAINAQVERSIFAGHYDSDEDPYRGDYIPMASAFNGIKPEQKFAINNYGTLTLYFDELTPEFAVGFIPMQLSILPEGLAYTGTSTGKVFTDTAVVPNLLSYDDILGAFNDYHSTEDYLGLKGLDRSIYLDVRCTLTDEQKAALDVLLSDEGMLAESPSVLYDRAKAACPSWQTMNMYIDTRAIVTRCGRYANVNATASVLANCEQEWDMTLLDWSAQRGLTWANDSSEPLTFEDIFVEGADVNGILRDAMVKSCLRDDPEMLDEATLSAYAEQMVGLISGFTISQIGLVLTFTSEGDAARLTEEYFPQTDSAYYYIYSCQSLSYRDLGAENLTIFGDM